MESSEPVVEPIVIKKRKGCPPGGWPKKKFEDMTTNEKKGQNERIGLKTRPTKSFLLKDNVNPGPYKNQNESWNEIEKFVALEYLRAESGWAPIENKDIIQWMKMNRDEILRERSKPAFTEFSLARAKKVVGTELARLAPFYINLLKKLADSAEFNDNSKESREALSIYLQAMDKFGLSEIDMSKAQVEEEFDTDEAMAEALQLVDWLQKRNLCPQNLVKGAISGVKQERTDNRGGVKEIISSLEIDKAPEVRTPSRPDQAMETFQVQLPTTE